MLKLNNITIKSVLLFISLATLFSCVEIEDQQDGAVGYLAAPSLDVDVTVEDMAQTKALDFEIEKPAVSEIHFVVKDKDGIVKYDGDGLWSEPLTLPVGSYTVEASAGENDFGEPYFSGNFDGEIGSLENETPALKISLANALLNVTVADDLLEHFTPGDKVSLNDRTFEAPYGEWFFVPAGEKLTINIVGTNLAGIAKTLTYSGLNSPVAKTAYKVVCGLDGNISSPKVELVDNLSAGAFEDLLYFPAATVSNLSGDYNVVYEINDGNGWTDVDDISEVVSADGTKYKVISGLIKDKQYSLRARVGNIFSTEEGVTFTYKPVSFQSCFIIENISAAHNNAGNTSVELSGTTMTASGMKVTLPSIIEKLAKVQAEGSFSSSINKATGSFSTELSSKTNNVSFNNATDWPYLPQGDYSATVTASCILNGKTYTASLKTDIEVPEPSFEAILTGFTSYDKYAGTNGNSIDVDAANAVTDASGLYEITGGAKISVDLLDNPNYGEKEFNLSLYHHDTKKSETLFSYKASSDIVNLVKIREHTGLTWNQHDLTVSMTFDGVTVDKKHEHHITGLPYKKEFSNNSDASGWSFVGRSYDKDYKQDYKSEYGYIMYYAYTNDRGCNVFSPSFKFPKTVAVSYQATFYAGSSGTNEKTYNIYGGVTTSTSIVNTDNSVSLKEGKWCLTTGSFNSVTLSVESASMSDGNCLSFSHNADLNKYLVQEHFIYIGNVYINYAN
jgi:hypothetical protein